MNKELFVSSTPHETKVGLVEDDLLAEIYLERENEYTLAGSIYKGRVTRVLPGMQSAFVDVGLERDAFLYVSDFMELEEHDDDLTDVVLASRGVQDLRQQPQQQADATATSAGNNEQAGESNLVQATDEGTLEADELETPANPSPGETAEPANGSDAQSKDRSWRGRRRRRGGRRDGRDRGYDRADRTDRPDRTEKPAERFARPAESTSSRPSGPPAGYQPILLPGESISKYQRYQRPAVQEAQPSHSAVEVSSEPGEQPGAPLAAAFPEDEPIFAAPEALLEPLHEQHEEVNRADEPVELASTSTSTSWKQQFRNEEQVSSSDWSATAQAPLENQHETETAQVDELSVSVPERLNQEQTPAFAAPGTMEEETIEEEEADTIHYESSSDEGYEEFEEET